MEIRLHDWGPSPFCLKVRAILDYKRVRYERVPALKTAAEVRRRGRIGKVPALEVDGRLVTDSTDIAYELERLFPQPSILPVRARDRALCHALEDWCDEALYFIGLHYQWIDPRGAAMVPAAFGNSLPGRVAYLWYRRRIRRQVWGQGTGRKPPERIEADLRRELAAVDELVGDAFVLGPKPMLCDFALMAQLRYLSRPPGSACILAGHRNVEAYLLRMRQVTEAAPAA